MKNACTSSNMEERLTAFLMEELPPEQADEVRRHLDACAACRETLEDLRLTVNLLRNALTENEDAPLCLDVDHRQRALRTWTGTITPFAMATFWRVAALLLATAGLGLLLQRTSLLDKRPDAPAIQMAKLEQAPIDDDMDGMRGAEEHEYYETLKPQAAATKAPAGFGKALHEPSGPRRDPAAPAPVLAAPSDSRDNEPQLEEVEKPSSSAHVNRVFVKTDSAKQEVSFFHTVDRQQSHAPAPEEKSKYIPEIATAEPAEALAETAPATVRDAEMDSLVMGLSTTSAPAKPGAGGVQSSSVGKALAWLLAEQQADGSWGNDAQATRWSLRALKVCEKRNDALDVTAAMMRAERYLQVAQADKVADKKVMVLAAAPEHAPALPSRERRDRANKHAAAPSKRKSTIANFKEVAVAKADTLSERVDKHAQTAASALLARQLDDGSWPAEPGAPEKTARIVATARALLILAGE